MKELKEFLGLWDEGGTVRVCARTPKGFGTLADIYVHPTSIVKFCNETGRGFEQDMLFDDHHFGLSTITIDTKRNTITLTLGMLPRYDRGGYVDQPE